MQFSRITEIETAEGADTQALVTQSCSGSQNHMARTEHWVCSKIDRVREVPLYLDVRELYHEL